MTTNSVSKEQIEAMIAGLEGVTTGPWFTYEEPEVGLSLDVHVRLPSGQFPIWDDPNAVRHIARCDPGTMLPIFNLAIEALDARTSSGGVTSGEVVTKEVVERDRARLIHILVVHFDIFRSKAEEIADLFLYEKTLTAALLAHPQGTGSREAVAPQFDGVAKRKLDDLLERGWEINGYSIRKGDEIGLLTAGAFVGWFSVAERNAETAEASLAAAREEAKANPWRTMDTAPLDGKHCILAVPESGGFIYSVQGAYQAGQWNAVHRDNVQPLYWMPNILLPKDRTSLAGSNAE